MMKNLMVLLLLGAFVRTCQFNWSSAPRSGIVTKVLDGDTVILQGGVKIRLLHIDCPEIGQKSLSGEPIGLLAKNYLEKKVLNKKVQVIAKRKGHYGRWLGQIYYGGKDISLELVAAGLAMLYPFSEFSNISEKLKYIYTFHHARFDRIGIWRFQEMISPGHYRKLKQK